MFSRTRSGSTGTAGASPQRPRRRLSRRVVTLIAAVAAGLAVVFGVLTLSGVGGAAHAATISQTNCAAAPSSCGFPDASTAGVPARATLKTVPGQVSSGPGWSFDSRGFVNVTGAGAVLSGLYIPYNVNVSAANVTLKDDKIVVGGAGAIGVSLRHATGVTIQYTTISGQNSGAGRMTTGVKDIYGDSAPQILSNDIAMFETGVQVESGLVQGNYIHDPGYITGDHTNGIMSNGGKTTKLTINHNTVLNSRGQTDAIALFEDFGIQANRAVTDNLVAGGGYSIYGGQTASTPASTNITITGNRFASTYYPKSGNYGPAAYYSIKGAGNTWTGNVWDSTGNAVPAP